MSFQGCYTQDKLIGGANWKQLNLDLPHQQDFTQKDLVNKSGFLTNGGHLSSLILKAPRKIIEQTTIYFYFLFFRENNAWHYMIHM